jgi:hypothetical protein
LPIEDGTKYHLEHLRKVSHIREVGGVPSIAGQCDAVRHVASAAIAVNGNFIDGYSLFARTADFSQAAA